MSATTAPIEASFSYWLALSLHNRFNNEADAVRLVVTPNEQDEAHVAVQLLDRVVLQMTLQEAIAVAYMLHDVITTAAPAAKELLPH